MLTTLSNFAREFYRPTATVNLIAAKNAGKTQTLVLLYLMLTRLEAEGRACILHVNKELMNQVNYYLRCGSTYNTNSSLIDLLIFEYEGRRIQMRAYPGEILKGNTGEVRPQEFANWVRNDADITLFLVNAFTLSRETAFDAMQGFLSTLHDLPGQIVAPALHRGIDLAFRKLMAYELFLSTDKCIEPEIEHEFRVLRSYKQLRLRYVPTLEAGSLPFAVEDVLRPGFESDDGCAFVTALDSICGFIVRQNVSIRTLKQAIGAAGKDGILGQNFTDLRPLCKGFPENRFRANGDLLRPNDDDRAVAQDVFPIQLAHELDHQKTKFLSVLVDVPTSGPEVLFAAVKKRIKARDARLAPPSLLRNAVTRVPIIAIAAALAFAVDAVEAAPGWKLLLWAIWLFGSTALLAASECTGWLLRKIGRACRRPQIEPASTPRIADPEIVQSKVKTQAKQPAPLMTAGK